MGNSISRAHNLNFYLCSDKYEAHRLLDDSEKQDFYIEEVHDDKANSLARSGLTYRANQISLRDSNYAISYLDGTKEYLPIRLLNDLKKVTIIQLMPTADGGMPHTRPDNIICYPDISQLFSKTTLIHELWHVHQRNYKDLWFKTFKRLGWTMWDGQIPENLEKSRRYNPDTLDCPFWIFNDEWIPLPIFKNISHPNVAEVEIWFYNPQKQYHIKRVPEEILSYFPNLPSTAYEHPREITAYILSEPDRYKDSYGFKHLIESIGEISIMMNKNENQY
jgi:hypothetical protein